jgi:hypothetical protein
VPESASSERRSGTTLQKAQVKKPQRNADNFPKKSRIPSTDIYPSRILEPGSNNSNKRGEGKFCFVLTLNCSHKFHKTINLFLNRYRKKI